MIYQYDGSAEKCPLPLVQMRVILKKMTVNDSCILLLRDQGSLNDIPKYLTKKGYSFTKNTLSNGCVELHIRTGK